MPSRDAAGSSGGGRSSAAGTRTGRRSRKPEGRRGGQRSQGRAFPRATGGRPRLGGEGPGARLAAALARAAADPGLDEEVGALRLTLARLLREEEADPLKVATAVARLAAVGVQAARTRRALAEDGPDELLAAVESWLEE